MRILGLLVMATIVFLPKPAAADSDGYYCVGRDYLAYETRFVTTPSKHNLYVVHLCGAAGIMAAPPIAIDDFQVHGMRCLPNVVELMAWNGIHSVDISASAKKPMKDTVPAAPEAAVQVMTLANLGHWSQEQVVTLDVHGDVQFQLVIARVSQPIAGGVEHHTVSRVIQRRPSSLPGREIIRSLQVFEGVRLESVN
jgi:hypothetical protein